MMNMLVSEAGPVISMPWRLRSSGRGGACQSRVVASEGGRCPGRTPSFSALSNTAALLARRSCMREVNLSWRARRYSWNSGVNSSPTPSTLATLNRSVTTIPNLRSAE